MTKALFTDPNKKIVIEDVDLGSTPANYVKVKTKYSYISAGTELTMLQMGNVNKVCEVKHEQLGYSLSGYIAELGDGVSHVKVGDKVACVGSGAFHSREVLVPKNLVTLIPDACSLKSASLSAMACFALEGIRKSELEFGENILVVGGGLMGQFIAQYAKLFAGNIILIERNKSRLEKIEEGINGLYADGEVWEKIENLTSPVGIEKAFFCLGGNVTKIFDEVKKVMCKSPDGISQGSIVFSGGATITVSLASPSGNLKILSSAKAGPGYRDFDFETGLNYPQGYVKWTVNRNVESILKAVADKKLKLDNLITHEYAFDNALSAYKKLCEVDTDALAIVLKY